MNNSLSNNRALSRGTKHLCEKWFAPKWFTGGQRFPDSFIIKPFRSPLSSGVERWSRSILVFLLFTKAKFVIRKQIFPNIKK